MCKYRINYKDPAIVEETLELITEAKGGNTKAENKLVKMYSEYIEYMVSRYSMKTDIKEDADLRSCIYLGFLEGIRRYDSTRNTQFIYFAHNWMKKMIFVEALQNYRLIRLPVNQNIFKNSFELKYGGLPVDDFSHLGDPEYTRFIAIKETEADSFSELENKQYNNPNYIDNLYSYSPETEEKETTAKLNLNINKILKKFSRKERTIIEYLFGLNNKQQLSSEGVADKLNITKVNVIFIKTKVIRLLRHSSLVGILLDGI